VNKLTVARSGAIAIVALGAATAFAKEPTEHHEANLDRDAALERVTVEKDKPSTGGPQIYRVLISDTCPEGEVSEAVGTGEAPDTFTIKSADTRAGKEVFFVFGNSFGRGGPASAKLVAWRSYKSAPCRRARTLYHYNPSKRDKPEGAGLKTNAVITLANYSRKYPGREVRLDEMYAAEGENTTSESILRRTFYRYRARRDKHTQYRKVVKRNQTP
jgi:hypothetical protein